MNISLGQVWMINPILMKLYQFKDEFDVKTNFKLGRNINVINPEYNLIEQTRISLIKKLGIINTNEAGEQSIEVPAEKNQQFKDEFNEFLKQEIELNLLPLEISILKNIKDLTLTLIEVFNFRLLLSDYDLIQLVSTSTTYGQLIESRPVINKLLNVNIEIDTSSKLSKTLIILNKIFDEIEEHRRQLAQNYNVVNWQQDNAPERIMNFNKDLNFYMTEQRTIEIPIIDIEKLAFLKLDPIELDSLSYMFDISTI